MRMLLVALSLSADGVSVAPTSRVVLGCAAAQIILGGATLTANHSGAVIPVAIEIGPLRGRVQVGIVPSGCSTPGVRVVADPEAEPPDSFGLVINVDQRPDGSWKILRVQSEIRPASRPAMASILDREFVTGLELTR